MRVSYGSRVQNKKLSEYVRTNLVSHRFWCIPPNLLATSPECWSYANRIILTSFLFGPGTPCPRGSNHPRRYVQFWLEPRQGQKELWIWFWDLFGSCWIVHQPVLSCALYDCCNASVQTNSRTLRRLDQQLLTTWGPTFSLGQCSCSFVVLSLCWCQGGVSLETSPSYAALRVAMGLPSKKKLPFKKAKVRSHRNAQTDNSSCVQNFKHLNWCRLHATIPTWYLKWRNWP